MVPALASGGLKTCVQPVPPQTCLNPPPGPGGGMLGHLGGGPGAGLPPRTGSGGGGGGGVEALLLPNSEWHAVVLHSLVPHFREFSVGRGGRTWGSRAFSTCSSGAEEITAGAVGKHYALDSSCHCAFEEVGQVLTSSCTRPLHRAALFRKPAIRIFAAPMCHAANRTPNAPIRPPVQQNRTQSRKPPQQHANPP